MLNSRYIVVNQESAWKIVQGGRRFPEAYASKTQAIYSAIALAEKMVTLAAGPRCWFAMRTAISPPSGRSGKLHVLTPRRFLGRHNGGDGGLLRFAAVL
jgi:hypothetical protein